MPVAESFFNFVFSYREANIKCLATDRAYSEDVPTFLHNKPRRFVEHCLSRIPSADVFKENFFVDVVSDLNLIVRSDSTNTSYRVSLSGRWPTCECADWKRHFMLCKHLLAVIVYVPGYSWDSIPDTFRNFPLFCNDRDVQFELSGSQVNNQTCVNEPCQCSSQEFFDSEECSISIIHTEQLLSVNDWSSSNTGQHPDHLMSSMNDDETLTVPQSKDPASNNVLDGSSSSCSQLACERLQSLVRQTLSCIASKTYSIFDETVLIELLQKSKEILRTVSICSQDHSCSKGQRTRIKRFAKKNAFGTLLSRRLRLVRRKKRQQKMKANIGKLVGW